MPFHPQFKDFMAGHCRNSSSWLGMVFSVRHPLAWLQSQSDSHHSFGHKCVPKPGGSRACYFGTCHPRWKTMECDGKNHGKLEWYFLPTLLDLWASYASHLPALPTVYIVRYEDLLHDPETVLKAVSKHFRVAIKGDRENTLESYSRKWDNKPTSTGISESRQRLERFEGFWEQFGVPLTERKSSSTTPGRPSGSSPHAVTCPAGEKNRVLLSPENTKALRSANDRHVLSQPLSIHKYNVPSADDAGNAWKECSAKTGSQRIVPPGYPTLVLHAASLPGTASADKLIKFLERRCPFSSKGVSKLAVAGLPNSGTSDLYSFLKKNLDVQVEPGPPGLWTHRTPFHTSFQALLRNLCANRLQHSATGIVFVVRHPIAWEQAQRAPGQEIGQTCVRPETAGPIECFFETCDRGQEGCLGKTASDHRYRTPSLLHLWGAYSDHIPTGLRPFLVVRYEDLLHDSSAVLKAVSEHFRVPLKLTATRTPFGASNGEALQSQQQWQGLQAFWGQFGEGLIVRSNGTARVEQRPSSSTASIQCPQSNLQSTLELELDPTPAHASRALTKFGYRLPSAEATKRARESCAGGLTSASSAELSKVLHWHPSTANIGSAGGTGQRKAGANAAATAQAKRQRLHPIRSTTV